MGMRLCRADRELHLPARRGGRPEGPGGAVEAEALHLPARRGGRPEGPGGAVRPRQFAERVQFPLPAGERARERAVASMTVPREQIMEKVVALTKRRGFIYPSSEIYGGLSGFYDYGPYGVALKRAIRDLWWRHMVELRDDVVGLESTLIMPEAVWDASGHLQNFVDPLRQCLGECKRRGRADTVLGEKCPECGGPLDDARMFNLMFKTYVGPLQDRASEVYLRPETAQGMLVDFKKVISSSRVRVTFGFAQQGMAFRREITSCNIIFRVRYL